MDIRRFATIFLFPAETHKTISICLWAQQPAWILSHTSLVLGDWWSSTPDPPMYPCASIHTLHLLLGTAQLIFMTLFSLDVPSLSSPIFSCTNNRLHCIWHVGLIHKGKNEPIIQLFSSFCQASRASFARCFFLDFFLKISISFSVQLFNLAFYWLSVFLLRCFINTMLVLPFCLKWWDIPPILNTGKMKEGSYEVHRKHCLHQTPRPQYDLLLLQQQMFCVSFSFPDLSLWVSCTQRLQCLNILVINNFLGAWTAVPFIS